MVNDSSRKSLRSSEPEAREIIRPKGRLPESDRRSPGLTSISYAPCQKYVPYDCSFLLQTEKVAMAAMLMPFDEIAPGTSVRVTTLDDPDPNAVQRLSARDLIMHMCDKDNNRAAEVWRRLSDDVHNEVHPDKITYQFPGQVQLQIECRKVELNAFFERMLS